MAQIGTPITDRQRTVDERVVGAGDPARAVVAAMVPVIKA